MKTKLQISESIILAILLTLSGGFQDAYSYIIRDNVFVNAQTGNIVLLGHNLVSGNFLKALHYFFPIIAFIIGIYITEWINHIYKNSHKIHWRQLILLIEIIIMGTVAFFPQHLNVPANILLSFSCAIQVSSFKKFKGVPFATTMCIGNMKNATEFYTKYQITGNEEFRYKSFYYYFIILIFALGATIGSVFTVLLREKAILISAFILFAGFVLMFLKQETDNPTIKEELSEIKGDLKKIKYSLKNDIIEEFKELKNLK